MQTLKCNVMKPSLIKIASVTGHEITSISKMLYKGKLTSTVKLDGKRMSTREARAKMLDGVTLVYMFGGAPCKV